MSLDAETPTPPIQRSRTPSPSPERLEEFRQAEAAAEPTLTVPGNLPSPSPQPDPVSITSPAAVPSNAVEGTVSGSHVASVQLGGGATGTEPGQVTMEATHMQDAGQVTMEGEADPGKSLGEGDPVGVNGEEEFADEDIRRAGSDTPRLSQDGNDLEQSETKEKSEQ
ncbi:hypothetical protein QFC19_003519 [Naganishia cerealis]|nr:hypothetical protein QFC19_003519 [Naganishia cerealis]